MHAQRALAALATFASLALVIGACVDQGPVARRVLSQADTDPDDFVQMSPSHDGRQVAYISMWDGSVRVRDLGTGEVRELVSGLPAVWHSFPRWSPDGRRLAVAARDQATEAMSIELIDVETRAVELVPGALAGSDEAIVPAEWSRDGRSLLCTRGHRLVLIALGEGTTITVADGVREYQGSLSPDGRFAVYATGPDGDPGLFISPLVGGDRRPITPPEASAGNPMWSPSGDAIAYESDDGIWVVPVRDGAASGPPRQALATGSITLQGWTGGGLYYTAWGESERVPYQIRMNPATGEAVGGPETLPGRYPAEWLGTFVWSPDMQHVAFTHWHPPAVSVYSARRGTLERFDVGSQGYAERPAWSADGREVLVHVVTPQVPGTDTVRVVDPETGRVRDLEPRIPEAFYASYSADGRTVAFARQAPAVSTRWQIGALVVAATGASDGQVVATGGGISDLILTDPGPRLSPPGDKVLYVRQDRQRDPPGPAGLWFVGSDGRGARQIATATRIHGMAWDPGGRFVAYRTTESIADSSVAVLHIVEVETGADRRVPLPSTFAQDAAVSDWSRDGTLLGLVASTQLRSNEYWVVQGLLGSER